MPQLDPHPWFTIFILSWTMFMFVIPPKIMAHKFTNDPSPQDTEKPQTSPWNWPWH